MKKANINVLRTVLVILFRVILVVALVAGLLCFLGHTALQTVLLGPSQTARDQLVLTLWESPKTHHIPAKYLDKETMAAIQTVEDTLDSTVSDPALITVAGGAVPSEETLEQELYTAQVTLGADAAGLGIYGERNFAGFDAEGRLLLASSQEDADKLGLTLRCGHILILNGQVNEGLFNAPSGFAPRSAIGQRADGTLILVRTDGWTGQHMGATHQDLINIMLHYGAVNACIISEEDLWNNK